MSTPDPDRSSILGTDRRIIALGFARMADAMGNSFLIVVLPLYVASGQVEGGLFGLSEPMVSGLVLALFGIVSSFAQPFTGRVSDRVGKRRLFVVIGLCIFAVSNYSFVWAGNYFSLLGIRAVQGFGAAITVTASVALVNEVSRSDNRGGNMGIYNAFRLVGFGAGPLASGALIEAGPYTLPIAGGWTVTGFEAVFYISALAAFVSAVLVVLLVEDPDETKPSAEAMHIRIRAEDDDHVLDAIFTLGLATFFMSACFALLSPIEPEINERLNQGAFLFSVEFTALVAALAVFQPLVGKASDRYGRKVFIVIGLIGLFPTTLAQGLVVEPWQMITARVFQGISAAMVFAPALALAGELAREGQSGAQLSVLTVAFGLGISFGQISTGYLIRYGFVVPFAFGAVLALIGAALVQTQVYEARKATSAS